METQILTQPVSKSELREMAAKQFGDLVKVVVDVADGRIAIGGELHADEESVLLESGSRQENLWGINLYPDHDGDDWIEFDSMINIRPSQGNRSRGVDDPDTRKKIREVVGRWMRQ